VKFAPLFEPRSDSRRSSGSHGATLLEPDCLACPRSIAAPLRQKIVLFARFLLCLERLHPDNRQMVFDAGDPCSNWPTLHVFRAWRASLVPIPALHCVLAARECHLRVASRFAHEIAFAVGVSTIVVDALGGEQTELAHAVFDVQWFGDPRENQIAAKDLVTSHVRVSRTSPRARLLC
jgi:hypothetical protein